MSDLMLANAEALVNADTITYAIINHLIIKLYEDTKYSLRCSTFIHDF